MPLHLDNALGWQKWIQGRWRNSIYNEAPPRESLPGRSTFSRKVYCKRILYQCYNTVMMSADDTALSNPEFPVDPATPAEEGWVAPTPLLVEGCGPSRGPDTSVKKKSNFVTADRE
ncbi:uncharacterized protein LOC135108115 isoform X4 [Scylla paramamosain]|uniref:uncharacterized protein LOC135108115 isoform X4 n=1 Tax=Scylla paramamosain TaxID=85552 RepID=UPI003082F840